MTHNFQEDAGKLRELLLSDSFNTAQLEQVTAVMEDLLIEMIADMISMGIRSFECPDVIIRLNGWRKR